MRLFTLFCTALTALTLAAPAHADYFVWQDPKTGASLSFPDTWRLVTNGGANAIVTISGPSAQDTPICRLRAVEDHRFDVYPVPMYSDAIQHTTFNESFWEEYTGQYGPVQVHAYKDDAGIGKAFASMAMISYRPFKPDNPDNVRTAVMWAGNYADHSYVFDCSSSAQSFAGWQPDFTSIAKSVDFRKADHELPIGHYHRNFIDDPEPTTMPVMNGDEAMGRTYH